jgi:hypothetical protein
VAHRPGNLPAGVLRLLGDVAAGLEAVEDVDRREHGDERGREPAAVEVEGERVGRVVLCALGREEEAEAVVEAVDREDERDPERADDLDVDAELRDVGHDPRAGDVHRQLDRQQDERDHEDRPVARRIEVPAEPVVGQRTDIADDPGVDGRDGDEQGESVEPAHEPPEAWADRELAVLVERPGHGIVARKLAEDERHEEHPDEGDEGQPDVRRTGDPEAEDEERVDPDHRRQVREPDREVREEAEHTVELWLVAQAFEPRVLADPHLRCTYRLALHLSLPAALSVRANLRNVTNLSMPERR